MLTRLEYGSVHQGLLENVLRNVFKGHHVIINSRKDSKIKNPSTGFYLEVDIWFPILNLCFEFQDAYHYSSSWDSHVPQSFIEQKDSFKKDKLLSHGATLIIVPCWWDGSSESLVQSILCYRPDLQNLIPVTFIDQGALPIPINSTLDYFKVKGVPGLGELMLASFPEPGLPFNLNNPWWVGEKYDGIRGCWQAAISKIFTRSGREIFLPVAFYNLFPDEAFVDGEFWFGRGCFTEAQQILAMDIHSLDWSMLRFVVFDNAAPAIHEIPFEERYMYALESFTPSNQLLINAFRLWTIEKRKLRKMSEKIIEDGGEGVILRSPTSFYLPGRSALLFKLKAGRADREALVVEVFEDLVILQQPDGTIFEVSTQERREDESEESDPATTAQKKINVKKGDVVMYSCENVSPRASPVNPQIVRIREDIKWEEVVVENSNASLAVPPRPVSPALNNASRGVLKGLPKIASMEKRREMRSVFEKFAKEKKIDPLVADEWYKIDRSEFMQFKGGKHTLKRYRGGLIRAIVDLFPEIRFDPSKFSFTQKHFWSNIDNRKKVFVDFARENHFDPYVANNWYSVTTKALKMNRSTNLVLQLYDDNAVKALVHLFPEIDLRPSKFLLIPRRYRMDLDNRKQFEKFAETHRFDPKIRENWYEQTKENLLSIKGATNILQYYEGSFITALQRVFPETNFDPSLFTHLSNKRPERITKYLSTHWQKPSNRRDLLELIAKDQGFDPLIPDNWYSISSDTLFAYKEVSSMLFYYNGSIVKALVDLFPEISFDREQFTLVSNRYWVETSNRIKLQQFAASHGFDPLNPEPWYNVISRRAISSIQGINAILEQYQGSLVNALIHLFPQVPFDPAKFANLPENHLSRDYKRTFFEKFAAKNGFDPLIPEKWYNVTYKQIRNNKMVKSTVEYYGHLGKALAKLFPEIRFNMQRFSKPPEVDEYEKDRKVFVQYAIANGFDPLIASSWYRIPKELLLSTKGIKSILSRYQGSFVNALVSLFPNIGLDRNLFFIKEEKQPAESKDYKELKRQRKLFEEFAAVNGFDPLLPRNWYNISLSTISNFKRMPYVLVYYRGSPAKALCNIFPEIGLDPKILSKKRH